MITDVQVETWVCLKVETLAESHLCMKSETVLEVKRKKEMCKVLPLPRKKFTEDLKKNPTSPHRLNSLCGMCEHCVVTLYMSERVKVQEVSESL